MAFITWRLTPVSTKRCYINESILTSSTRCFKRRTNWVLTIPGWTPPPPKPKQTKTNQNPKNCWNWNCSFDPTMWRQVSAHQISLGAKAQSLSAVYTHGRNHGLRGLDSCSFALGLWEVQSLGAKKKQKQKQKTKQNKKTKKVTGLDKKG